MESHSLGGGPTCGPPPRRGVRHLHAEAPVHLRQHQRAPRARRSHPEHLVPAAGDRPAGQVRGEGVPGGGSAMRMCPPPLLFWGGGFTPASPRSASGAGRRRWRRSRRCTRSTTRCSTAPAPSTARSWTAKSCWVGVGPGGGHFGEGGAPPPPPLHHGALCTTRSHWPEDVRCAAVRGHRGECWEKWGGGRTAVCPPPPWGHQCVPPPTGGQ